VKKAVFIDRDGVINSDKDHYYIFKIEDFKINPGVISALKKLQDMDYLLIVITNQGGISRGQYTSEDVNMLHGYFLDEMHKNGIDILDIIYCPHHHTVENCLCRKPKPLMLQKAIAKYDIDRDSSFFIGDKESDLAAGRAARVNTILIEANSDLEQVLSKII
jgi:D-glycero-D-manno-heptose 1,7-bisphosphate phosphatase